MKIHNLGLSTIIENGFGEHPTDEIWQKKFLEENLNFIIGINHIEYHNLTNSMLMNMENVWFCVF